MIQSATSILDSGITFIFVAFAAIISIARTVINYQPSHSNHVAFRGNTPCRVMSKSIGDNSDLWEIEVLQTHAINKMLIFSLEFYIIFRYKDVEAMLQRK